MINKNYTNEIRTCERIKFDQALYILTMYEKKIRKNRQNIYKKTMAQEKGVDADEELDDITYAWKNKWKMDLTKPVLNCVTSVYPRILMDFSNHSSTPKLSSFYSTLSQFIRRMRMQHEDETNYKFIINHYDKTTMLDSQNFTSSEIEEQQKSQKQKLKLLNCSKAAVKSILNVAFSVANKSIKKFEENFEYIVAEDVADVEMQGLEWQVIRPLRYIRQISRRSIFPPDYQAPETDMQQQQPMMTSLQTESQSACQLTTFVHNTIKLLQRIKQSQHGSTLLTIQPQIKQLTYVIHPLLAACYAMFKKENLQKQKDFDWKDSVPVQTNKWMENVKNSYNFSKIVLINLDGYQSQFSLQLARNFKKHLMYISFPKEEAILTDLQKVYSKRFFKKLMFKYTQALYQSYPTQNLSEDLLHYARLQQLNFNPQNYHKFIEQTYSHSQDLNSNMFIFPIRNKALKEHFSELFLQTEKEDIQIYESFFIKFIMKDFLINQIRQFNPSYVLVSYSGRVNVDDAHWVQIIQELTKVANYKLVMWPNLTTAFCPEEMMQTTDQDGNQCDYDNAVHDKKIQSSINFKAKGLDEEQCQQQKMDEQQVQQLQSIENSPTSVLQLFNKIARFLKVSSGTYNLTRSPQQDSLISKFKNQFILAYTDELMTVLGKEYFTIDRIRFKNKDLTIIPKLFEQNLNAIKKSFGKTVPEFYLDLYKVLEILLFAKDNMTKEDEQLLNSYKVKAQDYACDVAELWDQLTKSSSIEISTHHKHDHQAHSNTASNQMSTENQSKSEKKDLIYQIQEIKQKKNREKFMSLKQLHFIEISSQKFEQKISVYIKKSSETKQFTAISQQTQETQGLYDVTFLRKDRSQLKLFETTKVLYKTDQQTRQSNNIPILIMNNLSDQKPTYFQNYLAELDITQEANKERKNIEEKKVLALPITLKQTQATVLNLKSLVVKSDWNYQQTQNNLILYWPTEFDFLRAVIYKMLNRNYSPRISNDIYIAKKAQERNIFRRVNNLISMTEIVPRMGCSSYQFQDRLFVFGGFYDRERNYLNLQHDVTMFNLGTYGQSNGEKMIIDNLKGTLYSEQNFNMVVSRNQKYNSFIRPKMQFQIFDKSELADWYEQNPGTKQIILFGGYGQNFLRPYSMLTYYYYEIKLSRQTRTIQSIHKKLIYDKTIPINVKEMTKNLGIIKTNKKNPNTNVLETNKITEPNSYLTFRNAFKLQRNADNVEDFRYKCKYMFAEDEYRSFKTQIKKVQEQRTEEFDSSTISVEKMEGNNHLISLEKDGKKCVISLHLQIPHEKAKKLGCSRQVKLTHESIVYIDFWNSMICAVVKHDFYTKGKSVLVEYNIKSLQNLSFNHDQIPHIALTWIKQFELNLSLHILIACNKNTIAILHGQKLLPTQKVKEFIVKKKKNKTEAVAYQIQQRLGFHQIGNMPKVEYCYSVFFKQRNKILCLEYLSDRQNAVIIEMAYEIQLNSANDVYIWQSPAEKQRNSGGKMGTGSKGGILTYYRILLPESQVSVPLHKLSMTEYIKLQKQSQPQQPNQTKNAKKQVDRIIEVVYNKKIYYLELGGLSTGVSQKMNDVEVLQMIPGDKIKIEKENVQKGTILKKKMEQYYEII